MSRRGRTVGIVQARMRSERLPGKAMVELAGRPAIHYVLSRAGRARSLGELWLACTSDPADDPLAGYAEGLGVRVFRGDDADVMSRFVAVAEASDAAAIVRLTGDCPLADPEVIDTVAMRFHACDADFVSNTLVRSYPDGLDVEVFSRAALDRADREASDRFLRLHVTPYIHGRLRDRLPWGGFSNEQIVQPVDFSHLRWTLDEHVDVSFFRSLLVELDEGFGWLDVVAVSTRLPHLLRVNRGPRTYDGTVRDLGRLGVKSPCGPRFERGNEMLARAERVIPLASQTFSKSHQQWVRGASPMFLARGQGCRVWDLDGNGYIDHVMGLLPVILGYRDADVDAAIEAQLAKGVTFSLPHPLEVEVAERLVRLVPCAEMVRFGKNGSDATTAAVRLARAHTGRAKVITCGYHGWHDWYIGTTSRHHGVPAAVRALSVSVPFNEPGAVETALAREPDGFAAIILEPDGVAAPEPGYLAALRGLADRYGVVLIFDEIISGFRAGLGGAQAVYGVTPDLAALGKAIANGLPLSAVVGRAEIMKGLEQVFFSATFGGETLSLAAAAATLDKLEREDAVSRLKARGARLAAGANAALHSHGLGEFLSVAGADWWPRIHVASPPVERELLTSLLRQEFVANGLLLGASFNLCLAHDEDAVTEQTLAAFARALATVRAALDSADPRGCLRGAPVSPTFAVR